MNQQKESFDSNFEVFLADTLESKQIHFKLRYHVYCDEMGFENKDLFPDGMEFDEWDDDAVHFIVRHRASGQWVGGLRLVPSNNGLFPFEKSVQPYHEIKTTERKVSVEMSRLCVIKEARRFPSRLLAPYGLPDHEVNIKSDKIKSIYSYKNQTRSIIWGIFRAATVYCAENSLDYWYFIAAPALAGFIRREGFELTQIGTPCEHRGRRIPYQIGISDILPNPLWLNDYKQHYSFYSALRKTSSSDQQIRLFKRA
ncbi:PEP-CTERM/exosortase system-associated acyltransferase [Methylomonas sp. MgM2]